jgi:hypothetical protein
VSNPGDVAASSALEVLAAQGLCVIPGVLSSEELNMAREGLRILDESPGPYEKRYRHRHLTNKASIFRRLAEHPTALRIAESMLGDDCILSSMNERTLMPGSKAQPLHRDTDIWGPSFPWLPVPSGINVAWPLDPFNERSGATRWMPGSHRSNEPATSFESAGPTTAECPAGSLVAFDTRLVHAGAANSSSGPRRAVFAFYVCSWLKPQSDIRRSTPPDLLASASPTLLRLLGFRRQSPVQDPRDGAWSVVPAPGATSFYDEPPTVFAARPRDDGSYANAASAS